MNNSIKLFRIFDIDINLHISWWFILALLSWSLATGFFPESYPGFSNMAYWVVGILSSLLLFASVLMHELSHSLVAQLRHVKVESITLFFFGGVAGITREDMKPSSEFLIAIAGPLFSLFLAGMFFLASITAASVLWVAVTHYLALINLILALFNLIPGYPLDGGRAFRALLNWYYNDLKKATEIAVTVGKFFALFLIFTGIISMFTGIGGLWFVLIGGFLYFIAGMSYEQVVLKETLKKVKVTELMDKEFFVANPEMKMYDFVNKHYNDEISSYLVMDYKFSGILNMKAVEKMTVSMQKKVKLEDLAIPLKKIKKVNINDNAYSAFKKFSEQGMDILPVMEGKNIVAVLQRKKVMHRLIWDLKFHLDDHKKRKTLHHRAKKKREEHKKIISNNSKK